MNLTNGVERLSIRYKNQINITDEDTIDTVYNKFLAKLSSNRPNDIESKTTRYGIQR